MPPIPDSQTDPDVKSYREAFQLSAEFVSNQWELASRLYQLWRGKLPSQLDGTSTKAMLNIGHAIIQDRIPKLQENIFSHEDIVTLEAEDNPLFELFSDQAQAWLRHMLTSRSKLNIQSAIIPTLQSATIMGTGYRMPRVKYVKQDKKWVPIIQSADVDFFQILPAPNGGLINPMDRYSDDALPYFFFIDWMTDDQITTWEKYEGYDKGQVEKLFKTKPSNDGEFDNQYQERFNILGGVNYGGSKDSWRERMRDIEGLSGRRRVVFWFKRDELMLIAQDNFKIYKGPNPMPNGLLPLSKWSVSPDFKNFYGISALEMVEDMIHAIMMNFNFRMDHLTRVMFPTKWIRSDVMAGKPESEFYDRPYAVHEYPMSVKRPQDGFYYDRAPELTPQTFMDEDRMKMFLQEISGLPDYSKGMGGRGTLSNETATGIVSLIRQAQGRLMVESVMLEDFGLAQECRLLLCLAQDHILEDTNIRLPRPEGGFIWSTIEAEALSDKYTIKTHGTRQMAQKEQTFQKLMAMYPLWNQNPYFDQYELNRQVATVADVLPDLNRAMVDPGMMLPAGGPAGQGPMGGMASSQDIRQQERSVRQRNTVEADTGRQIPANVGF